MASGAAPPETAKDGAGEGDEMKTVKVVAAIICADGRVLATQRGHGEQAGGWEFPGGKVEPGETPEAAVVREIDEELATAIVVERLVTRVIHDYGSFVLDMDCFLCTLDGGEPTLLEHRAARWLDAAHLDDVAWLPADVKVVAAIRAQSII